MINQWKPPPPDPRTVIWETFSEDQRLDWLTEALRREGVRASVEAVTKVDDTFRAEGVGNRLQPLPKRPTGRVKVFVENEFVEAAKAVLRRMIPG